MTTKARYSAFSVSAKSSLHRTSFQGYMPHIKKCCPANDLMTYIQRNYLEQIQKLLKLKDNFVCHAQEVMANIASDQQKSAGKLTYVGIHNRRTVIIVDMYQI